jgi:hypothetical protein
MLGPPLNKAGLRPEDHYEGGDEQNKRRMAQNPEDTKRYKAD